MCNNKQLLDTPPLNNKNYLHEVVKYSLPRVDNHGIQCATVVLVYTYTEGNEKKKKRSVAGWI